MGRPKAFQPDEALQKALVVFWEKGYEATSMADLLQAMGIQRASLYDTFGSKDELFRRALEAYQARGIAHIETALERGRDPVDSLRELLLGAVPTGEGPVRGCLCSNAAVELGPHSPALAQNLRQHFDAVTQRLARVVAAGQAEGLITLTIPPLEAAAYLLTSLHGLHAAAKADPRPEPLRARVEIILRAFAP